MNGLMMNWQLTLDKILEHANRLYPYKRITTMQPDGSLHRYTYADLYRRTSGSRCLRLRRCCGMR